MSQTITQNTTIEYIDMFLYIYTGIPYLRYEKFNRIKNKIDRNIYKHIMSLIRFLSKFPIKQ